MSSSSDIVKRALKRLGIVAPGEDVDAADASDGNAALNAMIAAWQNHGIDIAPDVPIASRHEDGMVALLAVRLAPDYGKTVSADIRAEADRGWSGLLAEYHRVPNAQFDPALTNTPTQVSYIGINPPLSWEPQTAYTIGDRRQYRGRIYECTVAGTSAALVGPTARTTATDGTVTWSFVEVV